MKTPWLSTLIRLTLLTSTGLGRDQIQVEAHLDSETHTITGRVEFSIAPRDLAYDELVLQLYPNVNIPDLLAGGITVDSMAAGGETFKSAHRQDSKTSYRQSLTEPVAVGQPLEATVWFTTRIPEMAGRFGRMGYHYTLEAWFPMLAPWRSDGWHDVEYKEWLEPHADLSDISVSFSYSDSLQLIAPGFQDQTSEDGRTTASLKLEQASDLPLVLSQGLTGEDSDIDGVSLRIYYRDHYAFIVDSVRVATVTTLEYMAENVMPYPFDELTIIIGGLTTTGGLEMPRMILIQEPTPTMLHRGILNVVIHEVIHEWFYGIMNSNQADHPWLDESITEYFSVTINQRTNDGRPDVVNALGMTAFQFAEERLIGRPAFGLVPMNRAGQDLFDKREYYSAVYGKGTLTIMTIMRLMGPENERLFWQEYVSTHQFTSVRPDDFVEIADKYLPPTERGSVENILGHTAPLDWQVLDLSNAPFSVSLGDSAVTDSIKVTVDYAAFHPFGYPVDLRIEFMDGTTFDTTLTPIAGRHRLEMSATVPATGAILDPEYKYGIDVNLLNNSNVREGSRGAGLRLSSGILFLVESLFSSLWGF